MPEKYSPFVHGPLLVLLGALAFSTTGSVRTLCMPDAGAFSLAFVRALGAGGLLFLYCCAQGQLHFFTPFSQWTTAASLRAFVGLLGFQVFFFAALPEAGVTIGTVVTIGTTPIAVGILGRLLLDEAPSTVWYKATALALVGVCLLGISKGSGENGSALGVVLALAAGCSYGMFIVCSKKLAAEHPSSVVLTVFFAGTVLCLFPLRVLTPENFSMAWLWTPAGVGGAAFLIIVSTALAYMLMLAGLLRTPVALAATLSLAEPLSASLLGIVFLGEHLGGLGFLGLALLFASMIMLGRRSAAA